MSVFTTLWNLLKKNPATDGADTFNIETMLNDNWDKIDAALGLKAINAEVRAATTANITISGLQTVDGVALAAGDRVLVKNQTTASQNGIYTAAEGTWTRAADADQSGKLASGLSVFVKEGTSNGKKQWRLSTTGSIVLGTTALTFELVGGAGSATDAVVGNRTITDTTAPAGDSGTLTGLFGGLGYMIKAITGKSSWRTAPATTLEAAKGHMDATTGAHGATAAATANAIMQRDAAGRAKVAAPSASDDIARKAEVDAVQTNLATHVNATTGVHGAASAATANAIMQRDTAGRAKVAAPSASDDIARKAEVDAVQTNLTTHVNATTGIHGATSAATANTIIQRDASGRAKVLAPSTADDIARKAEVDAAISTAATDAATKANAVQTNLTTHVNATSGVHGATSAATASRIVQRDASGRAQFANPSVAADAATKGYVDAAGANMAKTNVDNKFSSNQTFNGAVELNGGVEVGRRDVVGPAYIDFHSSGRDADYDVRAVVTGGNGDVGSGELEITANRLTRWGNTIFDSANSPLAEKYQRLASGLIIQWGDAYVPNGNNPITFPIAFTSVQSVVCIVDQLEIISVTVNNLSNTRFFVLQPSGSAQNIRWIAIGY